MVNVMENKTGYVVDLLEADKSMIEMVGGKGANLGELCKVTGIHVPSGFCITTDVYRNIDTKNAALTAVINLLSTLTTNDTMRITELSTNIRNLIEHVIIPEPIRQEITR